MRIGELARLSTVSVRSLRYYEEQGMLESTRTPSGQREYGADAVNRVSLIQQLFAAGLASKAIRTIGPAVEANNCGPELTAELREHRSQIQERIDQLEAAASELDRMIAISTRHQLNDSPGCPRG
jgi:DNA-binding transcriptional MerR regulator